MAPHRWLLLLLLPLPLQVTGSLGEMEDIEEEETGASPLVSCVCQLLLNASEKLCFWTQEPTCPRNLSTRGKNHLDGPAGEMNWTDCRLQDARASNASLVNYTRLPCSENSTTPTSATTSEGLQRFSTAALAVSSSVGVGVLFLLLVGLWSMTLRKWRHERLFRRQLSHPSNVLPQASELSSPADAIYSNVINLELWKEDDFAIYGNVPPFDRARRTSPDQVEYASIVFH